MGQDMALYKMKRYGNATANDVEYVTRLVEFIENGSEFISKNYPDFNAYWKSEYNLPIPSQDVIDFYKPLYHSYTDNEGYKQSGIMENIYWSCGRGSQVHEWFMEALHTSSGDGGFYNIEVTKEVLVEVAAKVLEYMNSQIMEPVYIKNSYTYNDDDSITIRPSDGIEVLKDDNSLMRIDAEYSEDYLLLAKEGFDSIWYYRYTGLLKEIGKILAETNFEEDIIFYEASW